MIDYTGIYEDFVRGEMTRFYELMYPGLLLYAAKMLGDDLAYLAEDCVQDSVMSTYLNANSLENADHWRRYLLNTIHNKALKQLRHRSVRDAYSSQANDEGADVTEPDVSHALIRQETLDTLYAAIEELPPMYREVFEMSFEQGLKNADIAAMLDVAEITVKKRKERLITLLRRKLGGMSEEELIAMIFAMQQVTVCLK